MKGKVGLREAIGAIMLLIFGYALVTDPQFRSELGLNGPTLLILGYIGAFALPNRIAWIFQIGMGLFALIVTFSPGDSKVPGPLNYVFGLGVAIAMLGLGVMTFLQIKREKNALQLSDLDRRGTTDDPTPAAPQDPG